MTTTTQTPPIAISADTIAAELKQHDIQTWLNPETIADIEAAGYCIDFQTLEILPADEDADPAEKPWITITLNRPNGEMSIEEIQRINEYEMWIGPRPF